MAIAFCIFIVVVVVVSLVCMTASGEDTSVFDDNGPLDITMTNFQSEEGSRRAQTHANERQSRIDETARLLLVKAYESDGGDYKINTRWAYDIAEQLEAERERRMAKAKEKA